jgi:hypothetical protein
LFDLFRLAEQLRGWMIREEEEKQRKQTTPKFQQGSGGSGGKKKDKRPDSVLKAAIKGRFSRDNDRKEAADSVHRYFIAHFDFVAHCDNHKENTVSISFQVFCCSF